MSENYLLLEKAFEQTQNFVFSSQKSEYIYICFADKKADNKFSSRCICNSKLNKYLDEKDRAFVSAHSLVDAVFELDADSDAMDKGIFKPGEDNIEPVLMSIVSSRDIYSFSCIPNCTDFQKAYEIESENDSFVLRETKMNPNAETIWKSWMRIMWGQNWSLRYS